MKQVAQNARRKKMRTDFASICEFSTRECMYVLSIETYQAGGPEHAANKNAPPTLRQSLNSRSASIRMYGFRLSLLVSVNLCLSPLISISAPVCLYVCVFVCLLGCRSVGPSFRLCPSLSVAQRLPLSLAVSVCLCQWCLVACEMQPVSKIRVRKSYTFRIMACATPS